MRNNIWVQKALSTTLMITVLTASSMVALAGEQVPAGELSLSNRSDVVVINGEAAPNGRTFLPMSTVVTSENNGATLNLGGSGAISLDSNTTVVVAFDAKTVNVDLSAGSVTNLRSLQNISVRTSNGPLSLKPGETASAQTNDKYDREDPDGKCTQDTNKNGEIKCGPSIPPAGIVAIVVAAAVGVGLAIYFGTRDNNNTVSPVR